MSNKKDRKSNKYVYCDSCDCCQYIGEGDYICDKTQKIVMADFLPTEHYKRCRKDKNERDTF